MARPVGSLAVRLTADTSDFEKRMRRATRNISSMGRQMRSAVNTAGKYAAAITAAGAAIGTHLVRQSLKAIDETAKFARMIGVATDELVGMQHAAEITAGVTREQFNMALQRMTRRLAEAASGTGEAKAAIKELGLDAQELNKAGPDEAFRRIAEAMQGVEEQGDRVRIAFKLFDSEGAKLVNTLNAGAGEIERLSEEARAVGLAFNNIDAAQVEMANDAMTSISATLRGFMNRVAIKLAPIIKALADRFRDTAVETRGFQAQLDSAVTFGVRAAGLLGDSFRGIQVIIKSIALTFQGVGTAILSVGSMIHEGWVRIIEGIAETVQWLIEQVNLIPGVDIPTEGLENFRRQSRGVAESVKASRDALIQSTRQTRDELHDLLMEPLPSEGLQKFVEEAREAGRKAAEAVREEQARIAAEGGEKGGQGDSEAEARKEQLESRLEQLREGLMSEREVELEHQMQRGEILREAFERDLLTFQEFKRLTEEAAAAHQKRMTEIEKEGLTEREKFQRSGLRSQAKTVFGQLDNITAGVAQHNKELFKINQIAGIANAIISAYEGIALTMSKYPYPLNIAMAAAHATAAFAQVNAIRSATFSGGGGSAPSLSGGTAAPPSSEVGRDGGGRQQSVMINLQGSESSTFSRQQVRDLIEQINEASDDGAKVLVA